MDEMTKVTVLKLTPAATELIRALIDAERKRLETREAKATSQTTRLGLMAQQAILDGVAEQIGGSE